MKQSIPKWAAVAALATATADAHHSESMFETTPVWVKGKVVEYAYANPHSFVTVDGTTADEELHRWVVEGTSIFGHQRRGVGPDFFRPGDVVEFCAFPVKPQFRAAPSEDARSFGHGLVTIADGKMQIWGSYGMVRNCVRPEDGSDVWVDFLDGNEMARNAWCRRFQIDASTEESKALADEITRRMAEPCE